MPVTAPSLAPTLPEWPSLSDTEAVFDSKADAVGAAMPGTVAAINALASNLYGNAQYVESAANAGLASSNFKGNWAGLTGALNVPASVYHNGMYWQLLANLANVTTDQPGVTANWVMLPGPANALNYLDNGGCTVQQVAGITLTSSSAHSNCDRFYVAAGGGTGISGTNGVGVATAFATGKGVGAVAATFTSGTVLIKQRTESARTAQLNNKTITISCRVYQDFGTTRNVTLQLYKCNAVDNWTALTSIGTSSAVACASGAYTTVKHTITLGAADATNGFELVLQDTAAATVTNKSFLVSEWKMEVGSVATPFQVEDYADALHKCQRYYELIGDDTLQSILVYGGYASVVAQVQYLQILFKVQKWKTPALTAQGTWSFFNATTLTIGSVGKGEGLISTAATASGGSWFAVNSGGNSHLRADARL